MDFATALREAREKLGLSQVEIAQRLGVSPGTYGDWELGTHKARMDKYETIREVLGKKAARALATQALGAQAARLLR